MYLSVSCPGREMIFYCYCFVKIKRSSFYGMPFYFAICCCYCYCSCCCYYWFHMNERTNERVIYSFCLHIAHSKKYEMAKGTLSLSYLDKMLAVAAIEYPVFTHFHCAQSLGQLRTEPKTSLSLFRSCIFVHIHKRIGWIPKINKTLIVHHFLFSNNNNNNQQQPTKKTLTTLLFHSFFVPIFGQCARKVLCVQ